MLAHERKKYISATSAKIQVWGVIVSQLRREVKVFFFLELSLRNSLVNICTVIEQKPNDF